MMHEYINENDSIAELVLENLPVSIVYVDASHTIRYLNAAARHHYEKWGDIVGKSIFHCHNEKSVQRIKAAYREFQNGADEILYGENSERYAFMRSARDSEGTLVGYFEALEPRRDR